MIDQETKRKQMNVVNRLQPTLGNDRYLAVAVMLAIDSAIKSDEFAVKYGTCMVKVLSEFMQDNSSNWWDDHKAAKWPQH